MIRCNSKLCLHVFPSLLPVSFSPYLFPPLLPLSSFSFCFFYLLVDLELIG